MNPDQKARKTRLNLFRLFFLLFFGGMGAIIPFLTLHFREIGFSGVQISTLMMSSSLVLILGAPQYGLLYDKSERKRLITVISILLVMACVVSMIYARAFAVVLILWTVQRAVNSSEISALENLSFQVADQAETGRNGFGSVRLWGSLGFAAMALAGGWIYQNRDISVNGAVFAALLAASILAFMTLPEDVFKKHTQTAAEEPLPIQGVLKLILRDRYLWLTVVALALTDTLQDGVRSFEPLFMQDLGLPEAAIGLASTLSALGEVPIMLAADRLIHKFGISNVVLFIFGFDITRRLLVWFFPLPGLVFVLSVLTCVSFTLRLVCTVSLVNSRLPGRYTTTAMAFVAITLFGLGYIFSNAVSGQLYDLFGGRPLYLFSAGLGLFSLVLALSARRYEKQPAIPSAG